MQVDVCDLIEELLEALRYGLERPSRLVGTVNEHTVTAFLHGATLLLRNIHEEIDVIDIRREVRVQRGFEDTANALAGYLAKLGWDTDSFAREAYSLEIEVWERILAKLCG